ncbi:MAG: hypothetical protein WCK25_00205 [Actinomycetes bacterium]
MANTAANSTAWSFTGSVNVTVGGSTATATGTFSYTNSTNWNLVFTGSINLGSVSLSIAGGVVDSSGTISAAGSLWTGTLGTGATAAAYTCTTSCTANSYVPTAANYLTNTLVTAATIGGVSVKAVANTAANSTAWSFTGSGSLTFSGVSITASFNYTDSANWKLTLSGNLPIEDSNLAISGEVTSVASSITGSITASVGSVSSPLLLGGGASLYGSASASYSSTTGFGTLAGSLNLAIGTAFSASVAFTYTNSTNWSVTATAKTMQLTSSVSVNVSGSLSKSGAALSGILTAMLNANVGGGVVLQGSATYTYASGAASTFTGSATITIGSITLAATFAYTSSTNWTVSLSGANLTIGSTVVSVTGSLTKSVSGLSGTLTATIGSVAAPVTLGGGVSFQGTLSYTYNAATVASTFSGSGTIALSSSVTLAVSMSYTDSSNWSISVSVPGPMTFDMGISVTVTNFTGTVKNTAGVIQFSLSATFPGTVALIPNVVSLSGVTLGIGNTCANPVFAPSVVLCPTTSTSSLYLALNGTLSFTNPFATASVASIPFAASYGFQGNVFNLAASLPSVTLPTFGGITVSITTPLVLVSYNNPAFTAPSAGVSLSPAAGLSLAVSGTLSVRLAATTFSLPATLSYSSASGFALTAVFNNVDLGITGLKLTSLTYLKTAGTVTIQGNAVQVPAGTFVFGGSFAMPSWIATKTAQSGAVPTLFATMTYSSATDYSLNVAFPFTMQLGSIGSYVFSLNPMTISAGVKNAQPFVQLAESGTLTIPAESGQAAQSITITLAASYDGSSILCSITAGSTTGTPIWRNAFGITDLNLKSIAIQVGISLTPIPLPQFGISATADLPASLLSKFGISANGSIPFAIAINISATSPCIGLTIGKADATTSLSLWGGVVTAKYINFVAAPKGCTIGMGPGSFTAPAGFAAAFNGTILGVAVDVSASLTMSPFDLQAHIHVATFSLGVFQVNETNLDIHVSSSGDFNLKFAGGLSLPGLPNASLVAVEGEISKTGIYLQGSTNIDVGPIVIKTSLGVYGSPGKFSIDISGYFDLFGCTATVSGHIGTDGMILNGEVDFAPGGFNFGHMSFNLTITKTVFNLTIAGATLTLVPGLLTGNFTGQVGVNSSKQLYFNAYVGITINVGFATISGGIQVGNCAIAPSSWSGSCAVGSAKGPIYAYLIAGVSFNSHYYGFKVNMASGWSFTWHSQDSVDTSSGVVDTGLIRYQGRFSGYYDITVSSSKPYFQLAAGFQAEAQVSYGTWWVSCSSGWIWVHCHSGVDWGGWHTMFSLGVSFDTSGYFSVNFYGFTFTVRA